MSDLSGKKLLVLGGTTATFDVVRMAKSMGVYTIVADYYESGVAKDIADEAVSISTNDFDSLVALVREKHIDGAFAGPSEFNVRNLIILCEKAGLRCYADMETWNRCNNKAVFKHYCRKHGVDCPRDYLITEEMLHGGDLSAIEFPIIVKPADGNSSVGISICEGPSSLAEAYEMAKSASPSGTVVAEEYLVSTGEKLNFKYLVQDGAFYPILLSDGYVVDPKKYMVNAFSVLPSKRAKYYMEYMDANVQALMADLGIKNGTAFFQAIIKGDRIVVHDMGFRLSGGLTYKVTEPLFGINDLKRMIGYALGDEIFEEGIPAPIDFVNASAYASQLTVPLVPGTIASIAGIDECKALPEVVDFLQYYREGAQIDTSFMGTQKQHFARISLVSNTVEKILAAVDYIQTHLVVLDDSGERLNCLPFDVDRARRMTA